MHFTGIDVMCGGSSRSYTSLTFSVFVLQVSLNLELNGVPQNFS